LSIVRDQITRLASAGSDADVHLSKAEIRATIEQLHLSLEDVRTTKNDPNSTKKFCTGTLKLVAPAEVVNDAEDARRTAGESSLSDLADNSNVESNANAFTADIDFNVQPTDDRNKIFAEIENGGPAFRFFAELVRDHLLKSAVMDAKAEEERAATEQQAAENQALAEQQAATLNEAQTENKIAIQTTNAIWQGIPAEMRTRLLDLQKAWVRKKNADCGVEAASASAESSERDVARLKCDTRMQGERSSWLRQYMESGDGSSDSE
jgi:uncharacterized protein YecT (DUF1311 family)